MMQYMIQSKKGKMARSQIPNISSETDTQMTRTRGLDSPLVTNSDAQLP